MFWILIHYCLTAENISWILFLFDIAIDLSWGMNSIDYGVSMLIL